MKSTFAISESPPRLHLSVSRLCPFPTLGTHRDRAHLNGSLNQGEAPPQRRRSVAFGYSMQGMRIVLCAKDRGWHPPCTHPGCDAPAYHSQLHHVSGWTTTRRTDIDDLTRPAASATSTTRRD